MPHTITDGQKFPTPCPKCDDVAGMPFIASTTLESGAIHVGMRCRECGHQWRFEMPVKAESRLTAL